MSATLQCRRAYLGEVVCVVFGVSKTIAMGTWRSNLTIVFARHASIDTGTTGDLKILKRTPSSGAPDSVALLALCSATTIARVSLHSLNADRVPSLPPWRSCQGGRQGEGTVSSVPPGAQRGSQGEGTVSPVPPVAKRRRLGEGSECPVHS